VAVVAPAFVLAVGAAFDGGVVEVEAREDIDLVGTPEDSDDGGEVAFFGEVHADPALLAEEVVQRQVTLAAGVPLAHVHPGGGGIDPDVEMLGQEVRART